jgi:predicted transcriptional regulator
MNTRKNNNEPTPQLTRAEEEVMQILWQIEKGVVHELLEKFPEPKPAYNTVSTIIRILEQKGFVGHKAYGRTHEYFPVISKILLPEFCEQLLRKLLQIAGFLLCKRRKADREGT